MIVLHAKDFFHDGRGPELFKVHLASGSAHLLAIDFRSPDSNATKHLKFMGAQAFMFTPDEVVAYPAPVDWGRTERGALISLGQSDWLKSFSPVHLNGCAHIQAMFYDVLLDVICKDVAVGLGGFAGGP
jgi:hypothetical protein